MLFQQLINVTNLVPLHIHGIYGRAQNRYAVQVSPDLRDYHNTTMLTIAVKLTNKIRYAKKRESIREKSGRIVFVY